MRGISEEGNWWRIRSRLSKRTLTKAGSLPNFWKQVDKARRELASVGGQETMCARARMRSQYGSIASTMNLKIGNDAKCF